MFSYGFLQDRVEREHRNGTAWVLGARPSEFRAECLPGGTQVVSVFFNAHSDFCMKLKP